jgi:hypothetical protein
MTGAGRDSGEQAWRWLLPLACGLNHRRAWPFVQPERQARNGKHANARRLRPDTGASRGGRQVRIAAMHHISIMGREQNFRPLISLWNLDAEIRYYSRAAGM